MMLLEISYNSFNTIFSIEVVKLLRNSDELSFLDQRNVFTKPEKLECRDIKLTIDPLLHFYFYNIKKERVSLRTPNKSETLLVKVFIQNITRSLFITASYFRYVCEVTQIFYFPK